jgi:hypothetical protein
MSLEQYERENKYAPVGFEEDEPKKQPTKRILI